jgi:hypothetical protein
MTVNNDTQAPLQGAEFRDTQIYVPFFDAFHPGKELVGPGLGYCIASQGKEAFFVPTHIQSGYAASAESFYSEEMCQKYLQELAPLMNWNQPLEALVKDSAYQPKKFQELAKKYWIEDAGATAGGGQW